MKKVNIEKYPAYFAKILIFAVIYHLTVRLGLQMAYIQPNTSPVWPPTGLSIAFLLIGGLSFWPGITLGVLGGSLLTGAPFFLAAGMALGNTLEAVLVVFVLKKYFDFNSSFERLNDVVSYSVVSLVGTAIGASIGSLSLLLFTGTPVEAIKNIWFTWWIGDLLGALVVGAFLLVWLKPLRLHRLIRNVPEGLALLLLIVIISGYVFSNRPPIDILHQAMIYVIFPFVIWAALRFGQYGATASNLIISAIAILGTVNGFGPFGQDSINESLILLQTFMGVVAIISLILAAITRERQRANSELQQRVEALDALNHASKAFLGTFEKTGIYQLICKLTVEKFNAFYAWIRQPLMEEFGETLPLAAYGVNNFDVKEIETSLETHHSSRKKMLDKKNLLNLHHANLFLEKYPLLFGNSTLGTLFLLCPDSTENKDGQSKLIQSYANLAAVAIQNAWLFDEVSKGNDQLHALSQRLMKAQEQERLHLSRELHDESGQILAALMVELGLLNRMDDSKSKIKDHLHKISELSLNLQNNLHRLAANLRPASLDHLGLEKALEQYVLDFSRQHSLKVDFEATGLYEIRLPSEIETSIFRVIQESLTNVALHAEATHVDVVLTLHNSRIIAVVEDDGVGFITSSPAIEKQLGLFGMRERIEMLNGSFTLESAPGKGTTVRMEVPIEH